MASSWQYGPTVFDAPLGRASVLELHVPARGTIHAFRLLSATAIDGTFTIYNAEAAAVDAMNEINGESSSVSSTVVGGLPEAYRVLTGTVTDGVCHDTNQYLYANQDGTPAIPVGRLWLVLNIPTGALTAEVVIAMTIERQTLNS